MADVVKRTTLMVRGVKRAASWYERVFGMTRWMDTPFTLSGEMLAAGGQGDRTRLVIMKAEHDEIGMIGLLEWIAPRQEAPIQLPTRSLGCSAAIDYLDGAVADASASARPDGIDLYFDLALPGIPATRCVSQSFSKSVPLNWILRRRAQRRYALQRAADRVGRLLFGRRFRAEAPAAWHKFRSRASLRRGHRPREDVHPRTGPPDV